MDERTRADLLEYIARAYDAREEADWTDERAHEWAIVDALDDIACILGIADELREYMKKREKGC